MWKAAKNRNENLLCERMESRAIVGDVQNSAQLKLTRERACSGATGEEISVRLLD